jgi:hypothetical protein
VPQWFTLPFNQICILLPQWYLSPAAIANNSSCAAKYKSHQALRDDHVLFEQLLQAVIYTTDEITTNLVLTLPTRSISIHSDRLAIHHDISDGKIKIYVPKDQKQRQACYRSQLPKLLASILGVTSGATFDISSIVGCSLLDLENVLVEQDVSPVEWIERPVVIIPDVTIEETPRTPPSTVADSETATLLNIRSGPITPEATPTRSRRAVSTIEPEHIVETALPEQYPRLIEQVVESAQRAGYRYLNAEADIDDAEAVRGQYPQFDHFATFGTRTGNAFAHDRRIGAAGEAYVYIVFFQEFTY